MHACRTPTNITKRRFGSSQEKISALLALQVNEPGLSCVVGVASSILLYVPIKKQKLTICMPRRRMYRLPSVSLNALPPPPLGMYFVILRWRGFCPTLQIENKCFKCILLFSTLYNQINNDLLRVTEHFCQPVETLLTSARSFIIYM